MIFLAWRDGEPRPPRGFKSRMAVVSGVLAITVIGDGFPSSTDTQPKISFLPRTAIS
jgi:hypothetical protein